MSKLKSLCCAILSSSIANLGLSCFPLSSVASGDIRGARVDYVNCSQLQKRMNKANYPNIVFKGFETANLTKATYGNSRYLLYCNGGTIIDREEKTICRSYMGYMYSPKLGIAQYVADWGWTNGVANFGDSNKDDYCRRMK
jgi:hypothetical protein